MRVSRPVIAVVFAGMVVGGLVLAILGNRHPRVGTATFAPPYPEFNASGDPIRAVMEGRVACVVAGCDKLKVYLVLYETPNEKRPSTYWLGLVGTRGNERVVTQGTWQIQQGVEGYPGAVVYALDSDSGVGLRYFWRVNDNILLLLDERMSPRAGSGAWGAMLTRYNAPYGPRSYTWTQ